jgi:hypothetical protein
MIYRVHEAWKKKEAILEEQRLNKRIKKCVWELEQEKRDAGLQTSIDSNNKVGNFCNWCFASS